MLSAPLRTSPDECVHSFIHMYFAVVTRAYPRTSGEGAKDLVLVQGKCERRKIAREEEREGKERVKGTREKEREGERQTRYETKHVVG